MATKYRVYRLCYRTLLTLLLIAILSPLASLAFELGGPLSDLEKPEPAATISAIAIPSKSSVFSDDSASDPPQDAPPLQLRLSRDVSDQEFAAKEHPLEDLAVYDVMTVEERQENNLQTELPAPEPYYREKTVYLSFDDGPDPDNTPAVLTILHQEGVRATFFVVGNEMEKYPDVVRQTFTQGHALGNHTYSHIYREVYKSVASYTAELHHTDDVFKRVLGVRPRISRAPGGSSGSFTKEYWSALQKEGYVEVGWNINSGDASSQKADQLVRNIANQVEQNRILWSHAIVLMHDGRGHEETVKALPKIIHLFKEKGFEFRVITPATPPAW